MALLRSSLNSTFPLIALYFFLIAAFISQHAKCAVLPILGSDTQQPNSTVLGLQRTLNFQCSHEPTWTNVPFFDIRQCFVVIMKMLYEEGINPAQPDTVRRQFVSRVGHAREGLGGPIRTPRKYVARKPSPKLYCLEVSFRLQSRLVLNMKYPIRRMHSGNPDAFRCPSRRSSQRNGTLDNPK